MRTARERPIESLKPPPALAGAAAVSMTSGSAWRCRDSAMTTGWSTRPRPRPADAERAPTTGPPTNGCFPCEAAARPGAIAFGVRRDGRGERSCGAHRLLRRPAPTTGPLTGTQTGSSPARVAVITTVYDDVTDCVATVNVALVWPGATLTDAGTGATEGSPLPEGDRHTGCRRRKRDEDRADP